jgi:hypothetical protein
MSRIAVPDRRLIKIKATTGVHPVISRYHDGSDHYAPAERRARPGRALMVLALALLMIGLQPWNHGFSANAPIIGGMDSAVVVSADHGSGDRDAGIPAASHCLLHAGCAVSLHAEDSVLPVSYASDWPVFISGADVGQSPGPDPKPPKNLA